MKNNDILKILKPKTKFQIIISALRELKEDLGFRSLRTFKNIFVFIFFIIVILGMRKKNMKIFLE